MRFDWLVRTCAHDPNGGLSHEHFLHIYERPIVGAAVCPLLPACKSTGTRLKTRTGLMLTVQRISDGPMEARKERMHGEKCVCKKEEAASATQFRNPGALVQDAQCNHYMQARARLKKLFTRREDRAIHPGTKWKIFA